MWISDQNKKMIELATYLFKHNNDWIKLVDLRLYLNISGKTLRSYIEKLENLFPKLMNFDFFGSMVKPIISSNFGLITMQKTFLSNSLIVNIIRKTFFNKNFQKLDLAVELDTSESSIYRAIRLFNDSLVGTYDLKFSYADLRFEGEEREIQKFYINFFIETNCKPHNWSFKGYVDEKDMRNIAKNITKYVKNKLYPAQFQYVKVALAVAIIRFKQGYWINDNKYYDEAFEDVSNLANQNEVAKYLDREFGYMKLDKSIILYRLLSYFFSEVFYFFYNEPKAMESRNWEIERHHDFYIEKLDFLTNKYNIKIDDPEAFYDLLFAYFNFKMTSVDSSDFFVFRSDSFLKYVRFLNPDFHNDLCLILDEYLKKFHPKTSFKARDLTYTVYTLWPELLPQLVKAKPVIKTLLISNYDNYYARTLMNMLNVILPDSITIDIDEDYETDFEKIKNSSYDLIISDYVVLEDVGDKTVFSFEQLPQYNKIQEFIQVVSMLQVQKLAKQNLK